MWSFLYDRFTVNGQPLKPYCLIKCLKILVQIWRSFQNIRASPQFSCYVEFWSYMCVLQLLLSSCVLSYPAWQKSKKLNGVVEKLWTGFAHATCTHVIIAFLGSYDFLRFRKGIKLWQVDARSAAVLDQCRLVPWTITSPLCISLRSHSQRQKAKNYSQRLQGESAVA